MAYVTTVDASANNIPTAYDTSAGSKFTGFPKGGIVYVLNNTESVLAISIVKSGDDTPASAFTNTNQIVVPEGTKRGIVLDNMPLSTTSDIYLRSETGSAVTSGDVYIHTI